MNTFRRASVLQHPVSACKSPILQKDPVNQLGLSVNAPAKINLSLLVFPKRPDGYHEIHTVMATIDFCDTLRVGPDENPGIHLKCSGLPCPDGPSNIVYQAAEKLAQIANIEPAINIFLHKNIPAGAGLAGGSSDAAACLKALNQFWQLNLKTEKLAQIAAQLGSDVTFFLYGPMALCTGRGEVVKPLNGSINKHLLIISPDIHVPTPTVYQNYQYDQEKTSKQLKQVNQLLDNNDFDSLVALGFNNLKKTCMTLFEQLQEMHHNIEKIGVKPLCLSGSGATLFATSNSKNQIALWAQQINQRQLACARAITFLGKPTHFPEVHHADF